MKPNKNYKPASKAGVSVAILGASGYTGLETIRILLKHPKVKIKVLTGEKTRGKKIGEISSSFSYVELPKIVSLQEASFKGIDVIKLGTCRVLKILKGANICSKISNAVTKSTFFCLIN